MSFTAPGCTFMIVCSGAKSQGMPSLLVATADPDSDVDALNKLVEWCGRYTPFTAADGPDGIILDISGCAHLFCGEEGLLIDLAAQLRRMGLTTRIAAADTRRLVSSSRI